MDSNTFQSETFRISALENEMELLREQVETLKEELLYERKHTKEYRDELESTQLELQELNRELCTLSQLEILGFDEALKTSQRILTLNLPTDKSLKILLRSIYKFFEIKEQLFLREELSLSFRSLGNKTILKKLNDERTQLQTQFQSLSKFIAKFQDSCVDLDKQLKEFKQPGIKFEDGGKEGKAG